MNADDGFASVIWLALLALVALTSLAVADAANVVLARARASAAADAAALAAATDQHRYMGLGTDPVGAAREMAQASGATLESCDCASDGATADVTVSVPTHVRILRTAPSRVRASATARADPGAMFTPS